MTWAISAWPDPSALIDALGAEVVKQADEGNRAAQYSQGCSLIGEVQGADGAGLSGAAGRSPKVEAGWAHKCTFRSLTRPSCADGHLPTIFISLLFANPRRRRAWRF